MRPPRLGALPSCAAAALRRGGAAAPRVVASAAIIQSVEHYLRIFRSVIGAPIRGGDGRLALAISPRHGFCSMPQYVERVPRPSTGETQPNDDGDLRGPACAYRRLIKAGKLLDGDKAQERAVQRLQQLFEAIQVAPVSSRTGWRLWHWLSSAQRFSWLLDVSGVYLYGGVGTGKTMLMDLFFAQLNVPQKRRVHFHSFMLHVLKGSHKTTTSNHLLSTIADELIQETRVLCLDEIEVTDIADALLLMRLFTELWKRGVFLPFIKQLQEHCVVENLDAYSSGTDFRMGHNRRQQLYVWPNDRAADLILDEAFTHISDGAEELSTTLEVTKGRGFSVPRSRGDVARFSFHELCGSPVGAADYLTLTMHYRAVIVDRVPWLGDALAENETRRFVTLVDCLYEHKTILVVSASVPLEKLFLADPAHEALTTSVATPRDDEGNDDVEDEAAISMCVLGEGGSSGRSTTTINDVEWSATGLVGASLAQLQAYQAGPKRSNCTFVRFASRRALSRLFEMQGDRYLAQNMVVGRRALNWLTRLSKSE
eukprot:SM000217S06855  [mRNA]  locus=s217:89583:93324:+ [translate_table: standard]